MVRVYRSRFISQIMALPFCYALSHGFLGHTGTTHLGAADQEAPRCARGQTSNPRHVSSQGGFPLHTDVSLLVTIRLDMQAPDGDNAVPRNSDKERWRGENSMDNKDAVNYVNDLGDVSVAGWQNTERSPSNRPSRYQSIRFEETHR